MRVPTLSDLNTFRGWAILCTTRSAETQAANARRFEIGFMFLVTSCNIETK